MKSIPRSLVACAGAASLASAAGPASALDSSFHFKLGYDTGGDTVATALFVDGDTENIKANEGLFFGAGVSLVNDGGDIEGELSLSYKIGGVFAENGDVTWSSLPVEALVFYRRPAIRLGGGITYHLAPELDGSGIAEPINAEFRDSAGVVLQADYRIADKINIGLRYTSIEYEEKPSGATVDGDGIGVVFSGSL